MDIYKLSQEVCTNLGIAVEVGEPESSYAYRTILQALEAVEKGNVITESTHTAKEDFQHFLSYSGMWKEDKETLEKMFIAYCAALGDPACTPYKE